MIGILYSHCINQGLHFNLVEVLWDGIMEKGFLFQGLTYVKTGIFVKHLDDLSFSL